MIMLNSQGFESYKNLNQLILSPVCISSCFQVVKVIEPFLRKDKANIVRGQKTITVATLNKRKILTFTVKRVKKLA